MTQPLSVLILAAGLGTRLKPYTDRVPKPLVPVVDRSILMHQMDSVRAMGTRISLDHVGANAHHLAHQIEAAAPSLGIDHVFVEQPEILGTGGPLQQAWEYGWHGELLVMNSDNYHNFDLAAFVTAARLTNDGFALLCMDYSAANNLECDSSGHICGRDGKYTVGEFVRKVAFSGVSWYREDCLSRIRKTDFNIVDFWMREAEQARLPFAYLGQQHHTWIDMGSPQGFYRASLARLRELGIRSFVHPEAIVEKCDIGDGVVICEQTKVAAGTRLQGCIILPGAEILPGQSIENCIIGGGFQWEL